MKRSARLALMALLLPAAAYAKGGESNPVTVQGTVDVGNTVAVEATIQNTSSDPVPVTVEGSVDVVSEPEPDSYVHQIHVNTQGSGTPGSAGQAWPFSAPTRIHMIDFALAHQDGPCRMEIWYFGGSATVQLARRHFTDEDEADPFSTHAGQLHLGRAGVVVEPASSGYLRLHAFEEDGGFGECDFWATAFGVMAE